MITTNNNTQLQTTKKDSVRLASNVVRQEDVLVGKAFANSSHDGNLAFKALIQSRISAYLSCDQKSKRTKITFAIDKSVREAHGRFMERGVGGEWVELEERFSRRKVMETMRYAAKRCDQNGFRPGHGRQKGYTFQFNIRFDRTTSYAEILKCVPNLRQSYISKKSKKESPRPSEPSVDIGVSKSPAAAATIKSTKPQAVKRRASAPPERPTPVKLSDRRRFSDNSQALQAIARLASNPVGLFGQGRLPRTTTRAVSSHLSKSFAIADAISPTLSSILKHQQLVKPDLIDLEQRAYRNILLSRAAMANAVRAETELIFLGTALSEERRCLKLLNALNYW